MVKAIGQKMQRGQPRIFLDYAAVRFLFLCRRNKLLPQKEMADSVTLTMVLADDFVDPKPLLTNRPMPHGKQVHLTAVFEL